MAAAYATGTATDPIDLLQKLVAWLVTQGWTSDASATEGTGWRAHLHKGSPAVYVHFRAAVNEQIWQYRYANGYGIGLYMGDGYSGASAWNDQANAPEVYATAYKCGAGMELVSGSITAYHFFDDGSDNVVVVVERSPGLFVHLGFGLTLPPHGFTVAYPYFFGSSPSYWNTAAPTTSIPGHDITAAAPCGHTHYYSSDYPATTFVRVPSAIFADLWISNNYAANSSSVCGYTGMRIRCALYLTPGTLAATPNFSDLWPVCWPTAFPGAMLLPLHMFCGMSTGRWAPIGYPPSIFACRATEHGFAAGEQWTVGGVNYLVFPGFAVLKAA